MWVRQKILSLLKEKNKKEKQIQIREKTKLHKSLSLFCISFLFSFIEESQFTTVWRTSCIVSYLYLRSLPLPKAEGGRLVPLSGINNNKMINKNKLLSPTKKKLKSGEQKVTVRSSLMRRRTYPRFFGVLFSIGKTLKLSRIDTAVPGIPEPIVVTSQQ